MKIGNLDPVEKISGQVGRLNNLDTCWRFNG